MAATTDSRRARIVCRTQAGPQQQVSARPGGPMSSPVGSCGPLATFGHEMMDVIIWLPLVRAK